MRTGRARRRPYLAMAMGQSQKVERTVTCIHLAVATAAGPHHLDGSEPHRKGMDGALATTTVGAAAVPPSQAAARGAPPPPACKGSAPQYGRQRRQVTVTWPAAQTR